MSHTHNTYRNYFAALFFAIFLVGCSSNPVTGKRELSVVGTGTEVNIGSQQYAPARQSQGGDYVVDPELTRYVQQVGQRLVNASNNVNVKQRNLPYEFEVINSSVPNAWALPGGKIAINRGLLYELGSEAELAAVMGHEIVHSAARHGAKSMERGMLMQLGMVAVQASTYDNKYANLINQGTQLAAGLITQKYGRNAELESDDYGMRYMAEAGYDPRAAIDLQETFVRLSKESGRSNQGWLAGLFASHPPSELRVAKNKETAERLGSGGEYGRESYNAATANIMRTKPAYDKYDDAVKAYKNRNFRQAQALTNEAIAIEPREGNFHSLLGELDLKANNPQAALPHIREAIRLNPNYFMYYLQEGSALYDMNDYQDAYTSFDKSLKFLPTAMAHAAMGNIAERSGRMDLATRHYQAASQSNTAAGQQSAARLAQLEIGSNPGKYVKTQVRVDNSGRPILLIQNQAPFTVSGVQILSGIVDPNTGRTLKTAPVNVRQAIGSRQTIQVPLNLGMTVTNQAQLNAIKTQVQRAQAAR